uniref:FBA_2 domain-containing protein n=2 Tax=Caenorhabditis tropicalis TaxID=1561998 RepID=A0A1I7TAK4_9PELO
MKSKPLTYDSLKTVLLYMEPNIRFLLSSRAPSIRVTDKVVPLKINKMLLLEHGIRVNQTSYEYGIYQVDNNKILLEVSGFSGLNFIWTCDVDEFGVRDYINRAGELEKERYDQLINYRPKDNKINDKNNIFDFYHIRHDVAQKYKKEELELLENEEMVKEAIEYTNKRIKRMEHELLPFENKRKNIRPKFEIQLTKQQTNSEPCVIERVKYEGDLHKAGISLMKFMFTKRQHAIQVKSLIIMPRCSIQIPPDMKLRFKHLELVIHVSTSIETLKPIIDESSFPCEKLKIYFGSNEGQELDQEFIKHFKVLLIDGTTELSLPLIQNLQNQIVHFQLYSNSFVQRDDFIVLIRNWVAISKPIGTCFTFNFYKDESFMIQILNRVKDQIEGSRAGNKCVDIPMRNSTVLKVSYKPLRGNRFLMKMAVLPFK